MQKIKHSSKNYSNHTEKNKNHASCQMRVVKLLHT